jgi:hypothetical protein
VAKGDDKEKHEKGLEDTPTKLKRSAKKGGKDRGKGGGEEEKSKGDDAGMLNYTIVSLDV